MNSSPTLRKANSGFSLIEALLSLAVLSFGLLAIASFQGSLVIGSGYNKTRSEAMALAQQKLDDIRGYTTEAELVAKLKEQLVSGVIDATAGEVFPEHAFVDYDGTDATAPANVTVTSCADGFKIIDDASNPIAGTTQDFERRWKYCVSDTELLYTVVEVSWTDMEGNPDMVALHSAISWKNPAAAVQLTEIPDEPQVPSATGRAYLGDGSVTDEEVADAIARNDGSYEDNEDGTFSLFKTNDGSDVALVDADTNEIVLTLEDACKSDNPEECHNFVQIKGRVYRDTGSSSVSLTAVYVLASDAAYCARVYDTGGVPFDAPDLNGDGADYDYYDYTCYLGGGWYGNIGLLLTGNVNSNEHVCVGDPNAASSEGWKKQELAVRRVYRGLIYKRNPDNYNEWVTADGFGPVDDEGLTVAEAEANTPLFFSKGIGDGVQYPDFEIDPSDPSSRAYALDEYGVKKPMYPGRDGGHDYLLINKGGQVEAADCLAPATRPDSAWFDANYNGALDLAEPFTDADGDGVYDRGEIYSDDNGNGSYDSGEAYLDEDGDGVYDGPESYVDDNNNGRYDDTEVAVVGSLFANTPDDFICFNEEYYSGDIIEHADYDDTKPYLDGTGDHAFRNYPYLDRFNGDHSKRDDNDPPQSSYDSNGKVIPADTYATVYGAEAECRWDPSRPPPNMHMVYGTVSNMTGSGAYDLQGTTVVSSEGDDDCWFTDVLGPTGTKVTAPSGTELYYACRVFEWGEDATSNDGWEGSITLVPNPTLNVQCSDLTAYPTAELVHSHSIADGNSIEDDLYGQDFFCQNLAEITVSGSLTALHNDFETDGLPEVWLGRLQDDGSYTDVHQCLAADGVSSGVSASSAETADFSCMVREETVGAGWRGRIGVLPPAGYSCDTSVRTFDPAITADATAFDTKCRGTDTTLKVGGRITSVDDMTAASNPVITATGGTCGVVTKTSAEITYDCEVPFDYLTGSWTGTIQVANPTDGSMTCSGDTSWTMTATTDPDTSDATVACTTGEFVYINGVIAVKYPTAYDYCNADPLGDPSTCPVVEVTDGFGNVLDTYPDTANWPTTAETITVQIEMIGSGGSPDGACTPASIITDTADGLGADHAFSCISSREINWNQSWSGEVRYTFSNTNWATLVSPATGSSPVPGLGAGETGNVSATIDKAP